MSEVNRADKLRGVPKEELQKLLNESTNKRDVLRKLDIGGGRYSVILDNRIKQDNLDTTLLNDKFKKRFNKTLGVKTERNDMLKENSTYSRGSVRLMLIKDKLLEYKCILCNNEGKWQDKSLCLQLDHINGVNDDHRLVNLRFLCPNCHSQTDTFAGKNNKRIKAVNKCTKCNKIISFGCKKCQNCASNNRKKFDPSKDELEKLVLIDKIPMYKLGIKFGVSGTSVKKRCTRLGIPVGKHNDCLE